MQPTKRRAGGTVLKLEIGDTSIELRVSTGQERQR